ncbi:2Fe-2S iron-sulfur cluster binding domain-containing protein [Zoogloea sp.]|uniref:NADH:ubiquinone reductase (Na(+)-transporting) subunit F n=1 Tax=Zoogloea sp. TaxID=49181 RepID=UPI001AD0BC26|nr:2Fe-2S iron-sulfur cluster binding domain-containing protein [Zoogloea sp.]MBN8285180.1 2Fe-2S iron-sulfur cluster binding domain-containing protein [Zoogloea sp.]
MSYTVTIEPLGASFQVEPGQSLLDGALRNGIYLPHACCHGLCGTCKVQVLEGSVEHGDASPFALMDLERDEGRCLSCCATPLEDVVIEADIDEEPDQRAIPLRDFSGRVAALEDLTPTIKGVTIALDMPIDFQAGQYINLGWPGLAHPRAFSLAGPPDGGLLVELNIRHVPGGEATGHIHQRLRVGDPVTVSGPLGRFFVRKSDPKALLFIAGGSGLSSPRSMILDLLEGDGDTRTITLVYGARNRAELYYHADFVALAARYSNFHYVPALSAATPECAWEGRTGFVHEVAESHFGGDFRDHKAYLCGPPPMIESCIRTLMKGRLYERDIYTEKFLSAADAQQARSPLFKHL